MARLWHRYKDKPCSPRGWILATLHSSFLMSATMPRGKAQWASFSRTGSVHGSQQCPYSWSIPDDQVGRWIKVSQQHQVSSIESAICLHQLIPLGGTVETSYSPLQSASGGEHQFKHHVSIYIYVFICIYTHIYREREYYIIWHDLHHYSIVLLCWKPGAKPSIWHLNSHRGSSCCIDVYEWHWIPKLPDPREFW
jgi:hypothetical protein